MNNNSLSLGGAKEGEREEEEEEGLIRTITGSGAGY